MTRFSLLIFDDTRGRFTPLTDRRPVFDLRTGGLTTRQRIQRVLGQSAAAVRVPPRLEDVMREREPGLAVNATLSDQKGERGEWLLVNGRWLGVDAADEVRGLTPGQTLRTPGGELLAARLAAGDAQATLDAECAAGVRAGAGMGAGAEPMADDAAGGESLPLIARPWHILRALERTLALDIEMHDGPDVAEDANVHPAAVLDTSRGRVIIERGATVGPLAVLEGPCWIGADSTVQPHALISGPIPPSARPARSPASWS